MINLDNHFSRDEGRHSEWLRRQKWFIKARKDHERREELTDKLEDDSAMVTVVMAAATEEQIKDFEIKLEKYEAATVAALIENQKQLDVVNLQIADLLSRAYVMEDGRRVFKTEDGTQVFDEFGQEVSPDELDFDLIGPKHPIAEIYLQAFENRNVLLAEREELTSFQAELDNANERLSDGDMSEAELEELDAELMDLMPPTVREQIPEMAQTASTPDLTASFKSPAALPETPSRQISPQVLTPLQ